MSREFKNANWSLHRGEKPGSVKDAREACLSVLMDIRDELQTLNRVFACPNFLGIPHNLRSIMANAIIIAKNTKKTRRKKAKKA